MFKELKERYEKYAGDPVFRFSTLLAVIALPVSIIINYYAGMYATRQASNSVTDIILSNIPVFDVEWIFVYGSFLLIVFILTLLILQPKYIPFTLHSLTLFILTRSLFISLTHIAPFPSQTALELGALSSKFIFNGDLFFSGHTGIPFLMSLIFWRERVLRYVFIVWSIVFGITVLMGHLHYSIDVLAAFFITYVIFHISEKIFKKERRLSLRS